MAEEKLTYLTDDNGGLPGDFAQRFWGGARIEPRSRSEEAIQAGLEARIADPLWMLARQWQMGEFKGEDNGSPVRVEIEYETELLSKVTATSATTSEDVSATVVGTPIPFESDDAGTVNPPLETIVEREPIFLDWRTRVQIGQQFERFLHRALGEGSDQSIANRVIYTYRRPTPYFGIALPENIEAVDYATQRFLKLMQGRAIDGGKILSVYAKGRMPVLPAGVDVPPGKLTQALDDLEDWYCALYSQPFATEAGYWKPQKLEYEFMLSGLDALQGGGFSEPQTGVSSEPGIAEESGFGAPQGGRPSEPTGPQPPGGDQDDTSSEPTGPQPSRNLHTELIAPDYRNGDLDWYSCDIGMLARKASQNKIHSLTLNPTRMGFAGKPNERWWAFEDGNIDLAKLDTLTPNLGRLLMIEFALVYADDWYLVPLELPLGSITRIRSLTVHDVFGVGKPVKIESAIEAGQTERDSWQLFTLSDAHPSASSTPRPCLFLPPTLGDREESPPIEEIRFIRDEGANMVFAIEKTLQNGLGTPVDGFEAQLELQDRKRKKSLEDYEWKLTAVKARLKDSGLIDEQSQSLEAEAESIRDMISRLRGGPKSSPSSGTLPVYRFASPVPDNWIPYVPKKVPESVRRSLYGVSEHSIRLRQGIMVRNEDAAGPAENSPLTRVLTDERMNWLNEESVPRAGVKLQLTRQRVRWTDGKTYVWIGRKVVTGREEGNSGLKFDYLGRRVGHGD